MNQMDIHSNWKIRWCDGQRGGMPHYIHTPDEPPAADVKGLAKPVADGYDPRKWIEASVPGEVHNDLMRAGILPSPYEGTGVLAGGMLLVLPHRIRRARGGGGAAGAARL